MKPLFEENFVTRLDKDWIWIHEDPDAWKIADDALHLRTLPGTLWGDANNANNFLLRPVKNFTNGFATRVAVTNEPQLMGEQAGLIWYQDDDNYIKLVKECLEGVEWIVLAREEGGQSTLIDKTRISVGSAELQLVLIEGLAHGQFRSSPEDEWQLVGKCKLVEGTKPKVGLFSHGGPGEIERWVTLRGFALLSDK
ncbi:hypothetical protein ACFLXI_01865 [Chloroflexota bacterium]